ncbi:MAG: hypothetical protein AAF401_17095 [Pseudomonadota bacterium]
MARILVVHQPGDAPARGETFEAADEEAVLAGLDKAEEFDAVIVTPPETTAPGDAYQAAVAALTAEGLPVVEVTNDNRTASNPSNPGPLGAMAVVAGFGAAGFDLAFDLLEERLG